MTVLCGSDIIITKLSACDKIKSPLYGGKPSKGVSEMNFKILALACYCVVFCYNMFMSAVAYRSKNNPVPENVKDLYDAETYSKWQAYHRENSLVRIVSEAVSFAIYFVLIAFDVLPLFAVSENPYVSMITVLLFSLTLDTLVDTVFSYIYSMKIDEKYGFNKMTLKTFIADKIKSYIISTALFIGLMSLFILIYESLGDWILLLFTGVLVAVLFTIMFLNPYFSRIYNKFTPLEEGELRTKLTALLEKNGYHVREIQVMDASKRTTKSNAYFTGYGKSKTIVLFDTLIETMTPDEIVAVFAHELGHGLHKDVLKNSILSVLNMLVVVVMAWLTVKTEAIYSDFGFAGRNYGFALLLVLLVEFPLISPIFSAAVSAVSRRAEYRADAQAVKEGFGSELISALRKLSKDNLAHLSPSKIEVFLTYSHPPISLRIASIEKKMSEQN